jgi:hypothetical protein
MAAPAQRPAARASQPHSLGWLPASGCGNGLADDAWAPVLVISEQVVPRVLAVLQAALVPAYAAPASPAAGWLRDRSGRPADCRLWVGASAYGRAEAALLAVMPSVAREAAACADSAWR